MSQSRRGFTLVELLVVSYSTLQDQSTQETCLEQLPVLWGLPVVPVM